jgi:hypothetical protein
VLGLGGPYPLLRKISRPSDFCLTVVSLGLIYGPSKQTNPTETPK